MEVVEKDSSSSVSAEAGRPALAGRGLVFGYLSLRGEREGQVHGMRVLHFARVAGEKKSMVLLGTNAGEAFHLMTFVGTVLSSVASIEINKIKESPYGEVFRPCTRSQLAAALVP